VERTADAGVLIADSTPPSTRVQGAPFGVVLALIVVLGVLVRVVYIMRVAPHSGFFNDSIWYHLQATNIRTGAGYIDIAREFGAFNGHPEFAGHRATAYWPPLFPGFLAVVQTGFGSGIRTSQYAGVATGAATVALTGLLGRSIAGRAVGLLAALLAALSPFLIAVDGSLMSETLYLPLVLLALLLAQRARMRPTAPAWCALGAVIGLAALARGDALFLIVVVMIPTAILARDPIRHLLWRFALGLGTVALVLAPWVIRNAIEVHDATVSTVSANGVVAAANCPATYSGPGLGSWSYPCMKPGLGFHMSEATYSAKMRRKGTRYALDHVDRWPVVAAARVGRVWGIWNPTDLVPREAQESRNKSWQYVAWPISLGTLVLGLIGFRVLAVQHRPIAMLVAPVAMATAIALLTYGNSRFRTAAEPVLLIGTAATLIAMVRRLTGSPRSGGVPLPADGRGP
jgi:4-amino-4-deoxy-L-arabinose transferase-like glycosyltransferase